MKDYMEIGTTPSDEWCDQVGEASYHKLSRIEARVYTAQLIRIHGQPPEGAYFALKASPHDFGAYRDLVIYFDDQNKAATEYAFKVEGGCPERWDAQALAELKKAGYVPAKRGAS